MNLPVVSLRFFYCHVEELLKCGVGIAQDLRLLESQYGLLSRGALDLQGLAQRHGEASQGLGLAALCRSVLGRRLDKRMELRCSDWTGDLAERQICYAACDALVALDILEASFEMAEDSNRMRHFEAFGTHLSLSLSKVE